MPLASAQPIHTSLTIAVPSPPTDKECTIEATLKDENGNPLQNIDIDFYFCGTDKIGTNKTDSDGVASLKLSDDLDLPFFSYGLRPFETKKLDIIKLTPCSTEPKTMLSQVARMYISHMFS